MCRAPYCVRIILNPIAKSRREEGVIACDYFFAFGHSKIGGGGGVGSLGLPSHTDLLKRPFITGGCHLLLHTTVAVGFSTVTVAMLTALK